ncbi:nineteen complex-related protein 2-domain-containing protein [Xylogone sp. PMI_703]|nr:nineteen complex-related protein 2-domain-containing protein [Xylogone sp. PMI_703]
MSSGFGVKRRARKIRVNDDEGTTEETPDLQEPLSPVTKVGIASSSGSKPFKKSSLRQSIVFDDLPQESEQPSQDTSKISSAVEASEQSEALRSQPKFRKKKPPSSRLSFGVGEIVSGDAAEALEEDESFVPVKSKFSRGANSTDALRRGLPFQKLPLRSGDEDTERPTYSKDYLDELRNSTPNAPKALESTSPSFEDEQILDASELAGATIVNEEGAFAAPTTGNIAVPSEAEIREKKERRARLAHEKDFISLDDADDGSQLSLLRKKKTETRLVRDDEDFAEGFEEFVDDGRIALGRKQEREAKRRHRKEMEELIQRAEGSSDDTSDSEAERRAAYEDAQTRAGMDGLHKPTRDLDSARSQIPSKIAPIPALSDCLERLQSTLSTMEQDLVRRRQKMAELEQEKASIASREKEVQELLKETGARYATLKAGSQPGADGSSISRPENGIANYIVADRGLESFGNTPTTRPEVEDVG